MSKYPALFASLLASGAWSLEDLKKLAGLNFLRVFREVEKVSYFFCNEFNMASSVHNGCTLLTVKSYISVVLIVAYLISK